MRRGGGAPQGESLATWAMWAVVLAMILVTYRRLDPDTRAATDDLYHVSGNGLAGGLSRVLVELDFPIAIVAVLLALIAIDALPRRAWLVAGPAIALCAVVAWPGVVDQDDLDARWVNVVPALGVGLALALTIGPDTTAVGATRDYRAMHELLDRPAPEPGYASSVGEPAARSAISLTTAGSASVVVSPRARCSATSRSSRRMIFPERVFGSSGVKTMLAGFAIAPILWATWLRSTSSISTEPSSLPLRVT